jgi:hypothetical protein
VERIPVLILADLVELGIWVAPRTSIARTRVRKEVHELALDACKEKSERRPARMDAVGVSLRDALSNYREFANHLLALQQAAPRPSAVCQGISER